MKAFGVAALLITVGLAAACPQAGPFLAPGGPMGADVPKSVESPADTSDETLTPPSAPPEAGPKGLEMTDGGGPAAGSEQFKRYAGGPLSPIQPKSDEANITVVAYIDARLSYGPNYSQILPESPPMPFLLTKAGAPVTFNFLLELAFAGEDKGDGTAETWWLPAGLPLDAPNAEGGVVRLVHQPAGTAGAFYCDAQWTNPDPAGTNLSFPPLALGPGKVSFYQYQKGEQDAAHNLLFVKPTDFHPCGGLIPLTTGDPAQPFPPVAPPLMVHPLGSYALIPFKLMTTPLKMP